MIAGRPTSMVCRPPSTSRVTLATSPGSSTAEAKVAKFLLENEELFKTLKNTQIASILNLTPETLSRTLSKFKALAFIEVGDENHIRIVNRDRLQEML